MQTPYMSSLSKRISKTYSYVRQNVSFSNLKAILPTKWNLYISGGEDKKSKLYFNENVQRVKFICFYAACVKSYPLENIHHHEMFECPHRSILCTAQACQFINNVDPVIIHYINCPFQLLYCAICKSLYNVSVLTHDCNIIKFKRSIPSLLKYYHDNSLLNHSH